MKPPEFSVYASCKYDHNGREYHICVDERGEATVDIFLTSEDKHQIVVPARDSFWELSPFPVDIGETWIATINANIVFLRSLIAP